MACACVYDRNLAFAAAVVGHSETSHATLYTHSHHFIPSIVVPSIATSTRPYLYPTLQQATHTYITHNRLYITQEIKTTRHQSNTVTPGARPHPTRNSTKVTSSKTRIIIANSQQSAFECGLMRALQQHLTRVLLW